MQLAQCGRCCHKARANHVDHKEMGEGPGAVDLKYEQDRFVAFAFAMADAFVELDREYVIR